MSFDISRVTFDPWKDFSSVVMEQGRVQLDSDWNEWLAELTRRIRAGTLDIVGRAVYPATTPNAFLISPVVNSSVTTSITIGVGRMYVDGLLVENHGTPRPASGGWIPPTPVVPGSQPGWDPVLDELVGQNAIDYLQQPYFPGVAEQRPFPTNGGPFLVYLDLWQREVTFLESPDIIEKAVGVDTTGRLQTVWQVKLLAVSSSGGGNVTCSTSDSDIPEWNNLIQPSAGRLTTGVVQSTPSGPCCLATNTGYTGMENQLYRVEIHDATAGSPTFKWSRNNASIATSVLGISPDGKTLSVQSTGKDSVLRFSNNDWVEITDDWLELNGTHGELRQVLTVTDSDNTITLATAVPSADFPVDAQGKTNPERHTRLIKWDQQGKVYKSDGTTVWKDLSAGGSGDIPVPPPDTAIILENGITVSFNLDPVGGSFKVGDNWNFAARTLDGTVESLVKAPSRGIHHHYARLAMLTLDGQKPSDCRVEWPPQCEGCECASCVTADSHNSGKWTIQQAIDEVLQAGGGKVCLGPGTYNITQTIKIVGGNLPVSNLAISGHGLPVLAPVAPFRDDSILHIQNAIDIDVNYLAFSVGAPAANAAGIVAAPAGVRMEDAAFVRMEHCLFGLETDTAQLSPAIDLSGILMNCTLRENLFTNVQLGVAAKNAELLALAGFNMEHNQMYCTDGAVALTDAENTFAVEIRFANNFVQSASGFVLLGHGLDVAVEENAFSLTGVTSTETELYRGAVVCNLSLLRVKDNEIARNAGAITLDSAAAEGALSAGAYMWVVTAVEPASKRELLTSQLATLTLSAPSKVTLQWDAVPGITSYNVYRSTANDTTLRLVSNQKGGGSATVSFTDKTPDQALANKPTLPAMQNDGIVLGSTSSGSLMGETQITGNRITGLLGSGIVSTPSSLLLATVIARNQVALMGGSGLLLNSVYLDLDVHGNSALSVGLLADGKKTSTAMGIRIGAVINANISENRVEQVGPLVPLPELRRLGIYLIGIGVRLTGNHITDIGPAISPLSYGIRAIALGRLEADGNEVRRASLLPAAPDQSFWLAIQLFGENVSVQGNLLESFGGTGADKNPATAAIAAQSCTFSNNQCFLRDPDTSKQTLVASVTATDAIIAMGNLVQGPKRPRLPAPPAPEMSSLALILNKDNPPITAIGNITSSGIFVFGGMPAAMAPLNVTL